MSDNKPDYYKALYEVTSSINSSREPEAVLQSIVQNVTDAMKVKGCSLILLSSDKQTLMHTATSGLSDKYLDKGVLSADKSIAGVLKGEVVEINDASTDDRVQYSKEKLEEGITSILSVPMTLRGEIIGVVRVYTAEWRDFDDDDITFLQGVANLGAIALENARLYETVQKNYDDLRQEMLEWRTSMAVSGTPRSMWFVRHSRDDVFPKGQDGKK
ncbi:MAG: GAF domain-containing protein [Dehalococcoidales bacterium]|nr:GAF domain-containing protein [Dehalococcoidales bacterium]